MITALAINIKVDFTFSETIKNGRAPPDTVSIFKYQLHLSFDMYLSGYSIFGGEKVSFWRFFRILKLYNKNLKN